jgi:hypothetical protein
MVDRDPSTRSKTSFDLARRWISHCKNHHKCFERLPFLENENSRPTRLIDVRAFSSDIKLVETNHHDEEQDYVALSHCWGANGLLFNCTTTLGSLDERSLRIKYDSLPLNFQHAI